MQFWIHRIENERISAFSALNAFAEEVEIDFRSIRQIFLVKTLKKISTERLITSHRDGCNGAAIMSQPTL